MGRDIKRLHKCFEHFLNLYAVVFFMLPVHLPYTRKEVSQQNMKYKICFKYLFEVT